MSTEHAPCSFYRVWAPRNVGLPPVSISDCVKAPTSTSERAHIVYERQRTQHSAGWMSCNRDEACGFRTKAATELPLDQSWSHCCRKWAQPSVSWRTTVVIPRKRTQNRQVLWRSSMVLKLAVSRRFSKEKTPMCNSGLMARHMTASHDRPWGNAQ